MNYPVAERLVLPVDNYRVKGYAFKQWVKGRILPSLHLGDDVIDEPGTIVKSIGDGEVVWSQMRPGSERKRNWGGLIVIGHRHKVTDKPFYSIYGHIRDISCAVGDKVTAGQSLAAVAAGYTAENGWWKLPHLHFGLYTGPWRGHVLPGYYRLWERRTFPWHWRNPQKFITGYNLAISEENKDI